AELEISKNKFFVGKVKRRVKSWVELVLPLKVTDDQLGKPDTRDHNKSSLLFPFWVSQFVDKVDQCIRRRRRSNCLVVDGWCYLKRISESVFAGAVTLTSAIVSAQSHSQRDVHTEGDVRCACWMLAFARELIRRGLSPGEGHLDPRLSSCQHISSSFEITEVNS
nr:hypothetical protein [Tanacetum cinerariifolium]